MKLVTFRHDGRVAPGLWLEGDRVLDLAAASRLAGVALDAGSLVAIIAGGAPALAAARRLLDRAAELGAAILPGRAVTLLAPIPRPAKNVFCVGRNYVDHIKEGARARGTEVKILEVPQFFTKPPSAVIGPDAEIRLDPRVTSKLDYEVELGVVIGTPGRDIPAERAFEHIFGYTIINDVTARDVQRRHEQWFKGKALDTTCPMGPWIVERGDIADPRLLEISLAVNGELRQKATIAQMIFDIPAIIASLSAGLTLETGDVIATGTPSGVGFAMEPPHFLKGGDVVACTIEGIGTLTNRVIEA